MMATSRDTDQITIDYSIGLWDEELYAEFIQVIKYKDVSNKLDPNIEGETKNEVTPK